MTEPMQEGETMSTPDSFEWNEKRRQIRKLALSAEMAEHIPYEPEVHSPKKVATEPIVEDILKVIMNHSEFDSWWAEIGPENQERIKHKIWEVITQYI